MISPLQCKQGSARTCPLSRRHLALLYFTWYSWVLSELYVILCCYYPPLQHTWFCAVIIHLYSTRDSVLLLCTSKQRTWFCAVIMHLYTAQVILCCCYSPLQRTWFCAVVLHLCSAHYSVLMLCTSTVHVILCCFNAPLQRKCMATKSHALLLTFSNLNTFLWCGRNRVRFWISIR